MLGRGMADDGRTVRQNRNHGRDTGVANAGRDRTRRDRATGGTARDPATDDTARDDPPHTMGDTARETISMRRVVRHAIRRRTIPQRQAIRDGVTGDRRYGTQQSSRVQNMPGYARTCPDMPGYARICPDDGRLFPMMSRCQDCPATALRGESGPTIALSRAAERATIKRDG